MAKREVTVAAAVGLHARPAAAFAKAAGAAAAEHGVSVTIGRPDDPPADASSIVAVLSLGAKQGETLVLEVQGDEDDAEATLGELAALIEKAAAD